MNKITSGQLKSVAGNINIREMLIFSLMKASFDWLLHFVSSLFYADVHEKISTWDKVKELAAQIASVQMRCYGSGTKNRAASLR